MAVVLVYNVSEVQHNVYILILSTDSKEQPACNTLFKKRGDNGKLFMPVHNDYLNLRKKLVKCYIWSMALCGSETWTLRAADQKYVEIFKCGAGEGWRRSVGLIT